jgi:arsenate reductase-like glutaredoxin family protein
MAREFLSHHGIAFAACDTGASPVGAAATLALVRERRTCHVRWEGKILTWDQQESPVPEERLRQYFIHEDGGIRVPVLVVGEAVIQGYDEETYRRVLGLK